MVRLVMTESPLEPEAPSPRSLGWAAWMAIVGTVLTAAVVLFAALAFASLAGALGGGSSAPLMSLLVPVVIVGAACALVVMGLVRRSRTAYVVAFLLGAFTLHAWTDLMLSASTSPFELIPMLTVIPPAMVVVGLAVSWREFWQRDASA